MSLRTFYWAALTCCLVSCSGESTLEPDARSGGAGGAPRDASASGDQRAGGSGGGASGGTGGAAVDGPVDVPEVATGGSGATGGTGGSGGSPAALRLAAVPANGVVGLEWDPVAGVTGYRIYWSTQPGVSPTSGAALDAAAPGFIHRGLSNGTTYHYVVTALGGGGETAPSNEVAATPGGEWVLEQLGTGRFDDVLTGGHVQVPIEERQHILLFPEGYTAADLQNTFHSDASHAGTRNNDVDRWIDLVFGIEPYPLFREAFVVWYLPRPSTTRIDGGDTAFRVAVENSGGSWVTGTIGAETAARAWAAVALHPFAPTDFSGGGFGTARTATAAFLILDPVRLRAGLSGRATSLQNPNATSQRLSAAFGVGHAHEFTHAFAALRDEYMENDNAAPRSWAATSNVAGTSACADVPWAHLLSGTAINPSTDGLVGAFGRAERGFHSELLCLMNGTHDNGEYYARADAGSCTATSCTLRVEDRMCNFCREITAYRIFERTSVLPSGAFSTWVATYRPVFFERFGFKVPPLVPQSNDRANPSGGTQIYEECTAGLAEPISEAPPALNYTPRRAAPATCVQLEGEP